MRTIKALIILSLAICCPLFATLPAATTWEVRTVGNNNNGGCFITGSTGTDFSQQNAAQYTVTDLALPTGTTLTSATHTFIASDVGNCIHITAGTGYTAGFYQIVSVAGGTATIDRAAGTPVLSGGTASVGGALADINTAMIAVGRQPSQIIFVKATATYTTAASIALTQAVTQQSTIPPNQLIGYTTTRTDAGKATLQLITNTGLVALNGSGISGWYIRNFIVDCNSLGTSTGILIGENSMVINSKVTNCTTNGIQTQSTNYSSIIDTEVTGGTSCTAGINWTSGNAGTILRCWVHDNACTGILANQRRIILYNVVSNNTGATSDGISIASSLDGVVIIGNTIYKNGRHGILNSSNDLTVANHIRNNLLISNVGTGIVGGGAAGSAALPQYDGNAFFGNAATRSNMDDVGVVNAGNAAAPYTNVLDIILTADPFVSAATNNYSLNTTAGGGAAVRSTGTPGVIPGLVQTGSMDLGALQAAPAAASTGSNSAYIQ